MSFDGIVTRAVCQELGLLTGGRIYRIYQPHPHDIVLYVRVRGESYKLLLSANPTYPRVYLTKQEFTNPQEPPMFCMLLRKHCEGGTIESIKQVGMERIIHIDIKARDELGETTSKRLIVEIMGRHSNLILIDPATMQIFDSIQHVTPAISQYRQVLPGRTYTPPPEQGKKNPLTATQEQFVMAINWNSGSLDRQIVDQYSGISPLVARELLHQAGLFTRESLWQTFHSMMTAINTHHYVPNIATTANKSYFSVVLLTHIPDAQIETFASVSQCLEAFFQEKAVKDAVKQKAHDLMRIVMTEKQKNEKKIEKLKQTLAEAQDADKYRLYGELLSANLHLVKRGDTQVVVSNWYDEEGKMETIPLDPLKTPSENLQAYFKRYNKAKNSIQVVTEQIAHAQQEIRYLDGLLVQLEQADLVAAEEIRSELVEQGYLRDRQKKRGKPKKAPVPKPDAYYASDGTLIWVGKNNKQNEYLTSKLAAANHTWLHTKDIPGSHVVISATSYSQQTLEEAAMLAAYFSKGKHGSHIPVDYTLVKHVKKPAGAKPGFRIYEQHRTLYITPDEQRVLQLQRNKPVKRPEHE